MSTNRYLAIIVACLALAACSTPARVPDRVSPAPETGSPLASSPGAGLGSGSTASALTPRAASTPFYYIEQNQLRLSNREAPFANAEQVLLSDDKAMMAVFTPVQGRTSDLAVMNADGTGRREVTEGVGPTIWRPGTRDLLYMIRNQKARQEEWHLFSASGVDTVVLTDKTGAKRYTAVSPDGRWLAYWVVSADGSQWELCVTEVDTGTTQVVHQFPRAFSLSYPPVWLDATTVSLVENGRDVAAFSVPSGQRKVLASVESFYVSSTNWSPDRKRSILQGTSEFLIAREGQLSDICAGDWTRPVWSPSGRYLLIRDDKKHAFFVLDTEVGTCQFQQIPGKADTHSDWHPTEDSVILSFQREPGEQPELQLWTMTPGGLQFVKSVGNGRGKTVQWGAPR